MDQIKEAFQRVKEDIDILKKENLLLKNNLEETRKRIVEICEIFKKISKGVSINSKMNQEAKIPLHKQINSTYLADFSADKYLFKPQKSENRDISIGNGGVPTVKQSNSQTVKQTEKVLKTEENSFSNVIEFLNSLDNLKKEIRLKFKRLTEQEMFVFSVLYQLTEEKGYSDYRILSQKIGLTESSIRDYINRLVKKGIPVEKTKINNKNIQLSIPLNFKKIASLSTIIQLREI